MKDRLAPLSCIAAVGLGMLLVSLALEVVLAPSPPELVRYQLRTRARMQVAGRRLADALDRDAPVGIALGLSSMRDGFDPAQMTDLDDGRHWTSLAGAGGSTHDLQFAAQSLLEALRAEHGPDARVDVVVVGIHAEWLAETDPATVLDRQRFMDPRSDLEKSLWVTRNSRAMATAIQFWQDRARGRWMTMLGQGPAEIYGREDSHAPIWENEDEPVSEGAMKIQLSQWTATGWFEPHRYGTSGPRARALASLLRDLRDAGVDLRVVYMPCHSGWRSRTPPEASAQMVELVTGILEPDRILDLRDAIPDSMFADHSHLLAPGRRALTRRLWGWLEAAAP